MVAKGAFVGTVTALLAAVGLYAAPATGADSPNAAKRAPAAAPRAIGIFTPAAADPRLAAALARAGVGGTSFRFTPSEGRADANRAITVALRANRNDDAGRLGASPAAVSMAPLAYSLGAAVGWKRVALSGDVTKIDLGAQPGSREAFDLGVSYVGNRATARVKAIADRPLAGSPRIAGGELDSYSLDVGGSYSVTRNLAVTAGVRYKTDRDRLERLRDDRRDSQAVYVGTAFRF